MAFDQQQFRQLAKQQGISDSEINAYLQSKGISIEDQTRKSSGGLLGYIAPVLSTLPQALGLYIGVKENTEAVEAMSKNVQDQADLAFKVSKQIRETTDEARKEKLRKTMKIIHENIDYTNSLIRGLTSESRYKELSEATAIKIPGLADIPGLSAEPSTAARQIAGRSISQLGVSGAGILGTTGAGALTGAGRALERGESPLGIAKESAKMAVTFKITGIAFNKLANTQIGQRILTSPVGSAVMKVGNKIFSPFMAKPAAEGTIGAKVDDAFRNFGAAIDKLYSPSTYLKPAGKALGYAGQKIGLVKTPEQKLKSARERITNYWNNTKQRYQSLVRYDKNSPEVLGREGIIPTGKGGAMITTDQSELIRTKALAEHSLTNKVLEESRLYVSIDEFKKQATNNISKVLKGVEREQALNAFNKQLEALVAQNKAQIVEGNRMPIQLLNDWKSYMWSQGYASKLAPVSERVSAKAMRLSGNAAKNYINSLAKAESPKLADAIIGLSKHSGELFQAQKFLEALNGKKLPYGLIGRHFARVVGAIVGSSGGAIGSVAGSLTADQIITILQNPDISVGKAAIIIAQLRQVNPQAVEQALNYLKSQAVIQAMQKGLPPPSFIPLGPAGSTGR